MALRIRRLLLIIIILLVSTEISAQRLRRRRPHYPKFEILWPLHWVAAAYVWGFLKLGFIFAGLMLLLAYRGVSSWWRSDRIVVPDWAPVYHYRGFGSEVVASAASLNDNVLFWNDRINEVISKF